ncbi:LysR family transcriptional regulator [Pseudonocardia sp. CA-107938]|uniref:LysR family transcriptional regulator n=1 Tax=Pseudonocardia sp. CA-107938 TaxID=3240021 RepID=UPI003D8F8E6E
MALADVPTSTLRVFCEIAERRTLTAAAQALGYTQSAVSRQIATLERAAGASLLDRRRDGVILTAAGRVILRYASAVLDRVDATERELAGLPAHAGTVRLGWITSAGATLVPRALAALRRTQPSLTVTSREGGTPALVRALRVGSIDLAVLAWTPPFHPFDSETPAFEIRMLTERSLRIAVPAAHPLAGRDTVDLADLRGERWIAGPPSGEERLMGVWPGLDERPTIAHTARDWLAKLRLVEAGCGITTVGDALADVRPPGVVFLSVRQAEPERRRIVLAELPGRETPARRHVVEALAAAGAQG